MEERAAAILSHHHQEWAAELPGGLHLWYRAFAWERGLPTTVGVSGRGQVFLQHIGAVIQSLPVTGLLAFHLYDERVWQSIVHSPAIAHFRSVRVLDPVRDLGAIATGSSPHLGDLEELVLANNGIRDEGGLALAESTSLRNLKRLDLRGNYNISPWVRQMLKDRFGKALQISDPD